MQLHYCSEKHENRLIGEKAAVQIIIFNPLAELI